MKIIIVEIRFQQIKKEAVAEIEVRTLWTLEDHRIRNVATFHEITGQWSLVHCVVVHCSIIMH